MIHTSIYNTGYLKSSSFMLYPLGIREEPRLIYMYVPWIFYKPCQIRESGRGCIGGSKLNIGIR